MENEVDDSPIPNRVVEFHEAFGYDSNRRNNFHILDNDHYLYGGGVNYFILKVVSEGDDNNDDDD